MLPVVANFNRFSSDNRSIIERAMTSAVNVGGALIPQNLEEQITNAVIRLAPEMALVTPKPISGKTHEFDRYFTRPAPGAATGELSESKSTNSLTQRTSVDLKIIKRKGKISNFLIDASRSFIDTPTYEMNNQLEAHVLDLIFYMIWGNKDATSYSSAASNQTPNLEFDGIEKSISTNRIDFGGQKPTSLSFLDDMIDKSNRKGGARHRRVFGMSPEMLSLCSRLLTNVRLVQGLSGAGITKVDIGGGWRQNAYRDIPIIETSSTSPVEAMIPTATASAASSATGALSNGNYFFVVSPVTLSGEQLPSAETNVTLSGGTSVQSIKLTLSARHSGLDPAIQYRIYYASATGAEKLIRIVSAFTYDSEGTASDTIFNGLTGYDIILDTVAADSSVPSAMQNDVPLAGTIAAKTADEAVYLWDLDPIQGLGKLPYTNQSGDQFNGLVTTMRLAPVEDYIHFLVKSYTALTPAFEATSCWTRRIRRN